MTTAEPEQDGPGMMGPISYLIVEFPGNRMTGEGFPILVDLVDRGVIRILDLVFVRRDQDGSMQAIDLADIDHDGQFDLAVFEGVSAGLIDASDIADATPVIEPGSSAGHPDLRESLGRALHWGPASRRCASWWPPATSPMTPSSASLDATDR